MDKEKSPLEEHDQENKAGQNKQEWKKPTLEDVSEKIMAQPYIRFT